MTTFILIPGAMHGGWCFERILPLLVAAGHSAIAPDLPGMGVGGKDAVTLADWGDYVAGLVREAEQPVVLVGHSRGGIVIGEAAEREAELLAGIVYLAAIIAPPGCVALELSGAGTAELVRATEPDGLLHYSDGNYPDFYNRCTPEEAFAAAARLLPEPIGPSLTPATVTWERWGEVRRAYIECSDDNALPLSVQRALQAAAPCEPVVTLDTDHSPFLSAPELLTETLIRIADVWTGGDPPTYLG